jgi:hypothetical protein
MLNSDKFYVDEHQIINQFSSCVYILQRMAFGYNANRLVEFIRNT